MKRHNKRYNAPTEKWGVPTKTDHWAPKSIPGPHPHERSVPLIVIIRDILGYADNERETKRIIAEDKVLVDGRSVTSKDLPVGLMDVISFPDIKEHYRLMFNQHGNVHLSPVEEKQEGWKLCKIVDKKTVKNGITQYNLHDGRNILIDDPNEYRTKEVLKLSIPEQKVIESYKFKKGSMVLITGGKHVGEIGVVKDYEVVRGSQPNLVHFEEGISTVEKYAFVIGEDKPVINIPEVGIV
ncbi:MAG: 30S ribosomal protein S4e [Thermoplasmatota archaeon]